MAYTIKIAANNKPGTIEAILTLLRQLASDAGFVINDVTRIEKMFSNRPFRGGWLGLELRQIRRKERKAYCGQHAGPCVRPPRERQRRNSVCLDGEDWIAFHNVVNDVLDSMGLVAEVYTTPQDVRGKMWIRKTDLGRRKRYDSANTQPNNMFGLPHYVWNPGTNDQFTSGTGVESEERYGVN